MWQKKFCSKLDKIENPFSKRSLPLWCPKGENTEIVCGKLSKIKIFPNNNTIWATNQVRLTDNESDSGLCVICPIH
jgi:hypothetical protein